jgi:hypothetical protein
LLVGYRNFDSERLDVRFPFGHGLSYTTFEYASPVLEDPKGDELVRLSCTISNVGAAAGAETAQLYVHEAEPAVFRPEQELKAFRKIFLAPGETERIEFSLRKDAFSRFDADAMRWKMKRAYSSFASVPAAGYPPDHSRGAVRMTELDGAFDAVFLRLAESSFRSRFRLGKREIRYAREKGRDTIRSHARDFVSKRLAPARIPNDGKQTPVKGHPVFIAQHATATCCRGCLAKWHGIPDGVELSPQQQKYVVDLIMAWIDRQMEWLARSS